MKKPLALFIGVLLFTIAVSAPCPVIYTPPDSFVHLTDESQGLVAYDEDTGRQRYVVRQAYEGVASDFGLVLPTPGEPNMTEREEGLFEKLHDMTKEPEKDKSIDGLFGSSLNSLSAQESVQVVKQRDVGDFSATVLKANDSQALIDWLNRNGFDYRNQSRENFEYYIEKDEEFYFTALKINVEKASCLTQRQFEIGKNPRFRQQLPDEGQDTEGRCWLRGGLQPIEFSFDTERPMLPLRIMSRPHDRSPMTPDAGHGDHNHTHEDEPLPPGNFLVYTLAEQPLTVPGAKVKYSDTVSNPPPELETFDAEGKFLVRQRIKFNAHEVKEDLYFQEAEPFHVPREQTRIINPDDIDRENGMLEFSGEEKQVEMTSSPSVVQEVSFRVDRTSYSVGKTLGGINDAVLMAVAITSIVGLVNPASPFLWALLAVPVIIGLAWRWKRAMLYTFVACFVPYLVGITGFMALQLSGTDFSYVDPEEILLVLGIPLVGVVPATIYGVFSGVISKLFSRVQRISRLQGTMDGLGRERSIAFLVAATTLSSLVLLGVMTSMSRSAIPSSFLTFPALVLASVAWLYREASQASTGEKGI